MNADPLIRLSGLTYAYKTREALKGISFEVKQKTRFGVLGPNGSGKTTLFRILSTLIEPQAGQAFLCGHDLFQSEKEIRKKIGVVFQSPSLDLKLTVEENLRHQGYIYGIFGVRLRDEIRGLLQKVGLTDRRHDLVWKLSGGLRRRAELAKGLLHRPELLILDEPSTSIDPGARLELWSYLTRLRDESGMTVLFTTHLMEEAEFADDLIIMNEGRIVAQGSPEKLKGELGGDVLVFYGKNVSELAQKVRAKFSLEPLVIDGAIQVEHREGSKMLARILEAFPGQIDSATLRRPSLADVFIHKTGNEFWSYDQ